MNSERAWAQRLVAVALSTAAAVSPHAMAAESRPGEATAWPRPVVLSDAPDAVAVDATNWVLRRVLDHFTVLMPPDMSLVAPIGPDGQAIWSDGTRSVQFEWVPAPHRSLALDQQGSPTFVLPPIELTWSCADGLTLLGRSRCSGQDLLAHCASSSCADRDLFVVIANSLRDQYPVPLKSGGDCLRLIAAEVIGEPNQPADSRLQPAVVARLENRCDAAREVLLPMLSHPEASKAGEFRLRIVGPDPPDRVLRVDPGLLHRFDPDRILIPPGVGLIWLHGIPNVELNGTASRLVVLSLHCRPTRRSKATFLLTEDDRGDVRRDRTMSWSDVPPLRLVSDPIAVSPLSAPPPHAAARNRTLPR